MSAACTLLLVSSVLFFVIDSSSAAAQQQLQPPLQQLHQPSRQDVLKLAHTQLRSNGAALGTRQPQRAGQASTFARFLSGDTSAPPACSRHHSGSESASGLIDPGFFGADPTGRADSSAAFDKAVVELLRRNSSGHQMAGGITDLGGATIDLMGGDYLLSRPVTIPAGYGNFRIAHGTLRAGPAFPMELGRYLLEISDLSVQGCRAVDPKQKSCNENVGVEDILFDCGRRAWGGLQVNATMGANIGPDIYFVNFLHAGLTIHGGHESMLHEAWAGATYYGTKNHTQSEATSVAIEVLGNDHVISDVIIFGGQIGVYCNGGANLIEGVHTWNDATHAPSPGFGIVVDGTQSVRVLGVYLDYTALRLVDPVHLSVVDSFFLGMGTIVIAAGLKAEVDGLMIMDNTWANYNMPHNHTVVCDERNMSFSGPPKDLVMLGNVGGKSMAPRAVTVTKSMRMVNSTRVLFNFTSDFIFPGVPIQEVQYSLQIDVEASPSAFARHASRVPKGHLVAVETDVPVTGVVTMTASQGVFSAGNH